tara:strand:+ start:311 stop:475 length:165 start_codon:yes stop_codon:yes gene_type:complete
MPKISNSPRFVETVFLYAKNNKIHPLLARDDVDKRNKEDQKKAWVKHFSDKDSQ